MPLPATVLPAVTDTVLSHLATHFLVATHGDLPAARAAAASVLAAYDPQTEEELHLATDIVSFGFHALAALSEAAQPDLPVNRVIRLRGSAVSLSREAHKARRRLDQLKRAHPAEAPHPTREPDSAAALPEAPLAIPRAARQHAGSAAEPQAGLIDFVRKAMQAGTRPDGVRAWTQSHQQRSAAERITENLRRNQAEQLRRDELSAPPIDPAWPLPAANQPGHA
jgi:hypothetical protein